MYDCVEIEESELKISCIPFMYKLYNHVHGYTFIDAYTVYCTQV